MDASVPVEFQRFVAAQHVAAGDSLTLNNLAGTLFAVVQPQAVLPRPQAEGEIGRPVLLGAAEAQPLLIVAARRAAGFFRATKRTEVVWVEGDSELAVSLVKLALEFGDATVTVVLQVRCDQTGEASVRVPFVLGTLAQPAGLYAAAPRRPYGPELVITSWGDALVAFAWQCLLGLVTGLANATGKDARGNLLVPVEMALTARGLAIVPMARHRFSGSSGLKPTAAKR